MQAIGSLIFGRSDNKENNSSVDVDSNPNKLVSFINKNDVISCVSKLKANLPSNAIVISMVGESRRGKSMFLNCMISYLLKENVKAFDFKTNKETNNADCTNGIDYYVYKSKGLENNVEYIFLDVQGLLTTHSAADPHVLLLIYEISDIVIVNIGRSINNGSLQLLTPINSMAHRMSARDVKPKLLFRIYDADEYDEKLSTANFNNIFMHKQDQVEGIRNNIKKLFEISDKYIVWTETPNKQQKTTKDLLSLLADEELLFKDAIEKTFDLIISTKKTYKESFNVKLQAAISEINGLNVGARDFDNVNRYVIDEMLKWLGEYPGDYKHKIDPRLLSEISITQGTKTEYDIKCTEYEESVIQKIKEINKDIIGYISEFVPMLEMNYETLKLMLVSELENKYNLVTMQQDTYGIKTDIKTYKISYVNKIFEMTFISDVNINRYSVNCVKIKDLIQQINVGVDNVRSEFTELRNSWINVNIADYKSNKTPELKVFKTLRESIGTNYYYDRLSLYNQIKHNDNLVLFRMPSLNRDPTYPVQHATRYLVSLQLMGIDIFKIRTHADVKKLLPADAYKVYVKAEEYAKNNNLDWVSEQDQLHIVQGQAQYIHLYNLLYTFYQKWYEALACE